MTDAVPTPELIWTAGIAVALMLCAPCRGIGSVADPDNRSWSITEENDLLANPFGQHTDRHYTQGLEFAFLDRESTATNWISRLPEWGFVQNTRRSGFVLGQNIYTPEDLQATDLITTDRPYAGWLYGGLVVERRGTAFGRLACLESLELNLGVIGPESLATDAQTLVHRWRGFATPKGWDNQLKTEPGFELNYERLWRLSLGSDQDRYFDCLPHAGGSLGNVSTKADLGVVLRLGYHLPDDFGVQTIDSTAALNSGLNHQSPNFSTYLFVGVEGRAVGYTTFLDGNLFQNGPHVTRQPFVADTSYGFGFSLFKHWDLAYVHVFRTKEFRGQHNHDEFGSIIIQCRFPF